MAIPIGNWGKDHWSTFAYIETLAVDHDGIAIPEPCRMRTNHKIHHYMGGPIDGSGYPTILKNGNVVRGHDDWDCLDDAVISELLIEIGTDLHRAFSLTEIGREVANLLREHKANRGTFQNFSERFEKD